MKKPNDPFRAWGFGKEYPWMDLANTLEWNGFGQLTDHLKNPEWLALYLRRWNFGRLPSQVPIRQLKQLRTALRRLAAKISAGTALGTRDIALLNSKMNVPLNQKLVHRRNGWKLEIVPVRGDWSWIFSRIVASLGEMLALGTNQRLKYCPNQGCRWIFFDQTKGGTRRWCNDRTCGNRDRVRRSRRQHKKSGTRKNNG